MSSKLFTTMGLKFTPEQIQAATQPSNQPTVEQALYMHSILKYLRALDGDNCQVSHVRACCGGTLDECNHVLGVFIMTGNVVLSYERVGEDSRILYYLKETAPPEALSHTAYLVKHQSGLPVEEQDWPPVFVTPTSETRAP